MTLMQSSEATLTKIFMITLMMKLIHASIPDLAMTPAPAPQDHFPKTNRQQRGFVRGTKSAAYFYGGER